MSKTVQSNLIVHKGLAITALGQFIQVLLTESLKEMGQNIDKVITSYVDKLINEQKQGLRVDLSKIDFAGLAVEVKKEVVKTFENMKTEFEESKPHESQP